MKYLAQNSGWREPGFHAQHSIHANTRHGMAWHGMALLCQLTCCITALPGKRAATALSGHAGQAHLAAQHALLARAATQGAQACAAD